MFNPFASFLNSTPAVDVAQAVRDVAEGKALLIDVREEAELRAGKATGALNLPLGRLHETANPQSGHFDKRLAKALKSGQPIYLYCASGARSGRAEGILRRFGFENVHNIGHLGAWQAAGGTVSR